MAYILLVINVVILLSGQMLWKKAVDNVKVPEGTEMVIHWNARTAWDVLWSPQFIGGSALYVLATLIWLYIMSKLPFSVAYPLQSISYIGGLIASVYILKEQVVTMQWLGAIVILVGVIMIASKG